MESRVSPSRSPRRRSLQADFFVELTLSPVVAGFALLLPVVKHWGAYGYIPAIVWLALFIRCLFAFRCRGLWYLAGPPVAFLVIEVFLVAAPAAPQVTAPAAPSVSQ